jgi:hypothetical protein
VEHKGSAGTCWIFLVQQPLEQQDSLPAQSRVIPGKVPGIQKVGGALERIDIQGSRPSPSHRDGGAVPPESVFERDFDN